MSVDNPYDDTALIVDVAAIQASLDAAAVLVEAVLEALHSAQYVYPELAGPVTLPASGGAWGYGALTQVVPINTIASPYTVHELAISGMSANASFVGKITYGADDTVWAYFSVTRGGVQAQSVVIPVSGVIIPTNSVLKMQLADSVGTSTLAVKIAYHIHI